MFDGGQKRRGLTALALAGWALLSHVLYLGGGVTWLDHVDLAWMRQERALSSALLSPFGDSHWYRPLIQLSYWVEHALFGEWAQGFHATNVLVHAFSTALVFLLLSRFASSRAAAACGAFLFSIHPASALPVGAINARTDLFATAATLAALLFAVKALESGRRVHFFFVGCFYFLAAASKESALAWLPVTLALAWWTWRDVRAPSRKVVLGIAASVALAALLYLALRVHALSGSSVPARRDLTLAAWLTVVGRFAGQLLLSPFVPSMSDAVDAHRLGVWAGAGAVSLLSLPLAAVLLWKRERPSAFAVLALLATAVPLYATAFVPRLIQPHYAYFSTVWVALLASRIVEQARAWRPAIRNLVTVTGGIWLVIASWSSARHGLRFRGDEQLFAPEVRRDGRYREGLFYLGLAHAREGRWSAAESELRRAIEAREDVFAYVDVSQAWMNLGAVHLRMNQPALAERDLEQAWQLRVEGQSREEELLYDLALAKLLQGKSADVISILAGRATQDSPPELALLLAQAYATSGAGDDARRALIRTEGRLTSEEQKRWSARLRALLGD